MSTTKTKALTSDQVDKLERFISCSPDATEFAKKALIWMLRQSQGMTKTVCLTFTPDKSSLGRQVAHGVHDMRSANGSTFINRFLDELGAPMSFSSRSGYYTGKKTSLISGQRDIQAG